MVETHAHVHKQEVFETEDEAILHAVRAALRDGYAAQVFLPSGQRISIQVSTF